MDAQRPLPSGSGIGRLARYHISDPELLFLSGYSDAYSVLALVAAMSFACLESAHERPSSHVAFPLAQKCRNP